MVHGSELARLKKEVATGTHSVASPPDGAIFYSDDEGRNRQLAEAHLARRCSEGKPATTLEATPCGKWLESQRLYEKSTSPLSRSEADEVWATASVKYANEASGSCRCFIVNAPEHRVFRTHELAALLNNDKVTDLNNVPRAALKTVFERDPNAAFAAVEQADKSLRASATTPVGAMAPAASASAATTSGTSGSAGGGLPAARISDLHVCPMVTGVVPHVGGPIAMGCPTVLIGGLPAARIGDMATCVGPPDVIAKGCPKVLIGGMPAARMSDLCAHGGQIVLGDFTVLIG